jgi:hypothetical protein
MLGNRCFWSPLYNFQKCPSHHAELQCALNGYLCCVMSSCHVLMSSFHLIMSCHHVMWSCHCVMSLCHVIMPCHHVMSSYHVILCHHVMSSCPVMSSAKFAVVLSHCVTSSCYGLQVRCVNMGFGTHIEIDLALLQNALKTSFLSFIITLF